MNRSLACRTVSSKKSLTNPGNSASANSLKIGIAHSSVSSEAGSSRDATTHTFALLPRSASILPAVILVQVVVLVQDSCRPFLSSNDD